MDNIQNPEVAAGFNSYAEKIREKLLSLRKLILQTAAESRDVEALEQTLKWGEPSYLAKQASTIRMGWKDSQPDQVA